MGGRHKGKDGSVEAGWASTQEEKALFKQDAGEGAVKGEKARSQTCLPMNGGELFKEQMLLTV